MVISDSLKKEFPIRILEKSTFKRTIPSLEKESAILQVFWFGV